MNTGTMCTCHVRASSYGKVDAAEQKDIVNSGVRGAVRCAKQERRPTSGLRLVASNTWPTTFKYLAPVNYSDGAPPAGASSLRTRRWHFLVPLRARAGSIVCTMQELV
jgi:hypothetical protein